MATYYVRADGNNANAGTGQASNQAWQTIAKAITSAVAPGDTIYIAPGIYRESGLTPTFTNPSSNAQRISYIGDTSASQFIGVATGPVIITTYATNTSGQTTHLMIWAKDYTSFTNICFIGYPLTTAPTYGTLIKYSGIYPIFTKCLIQQTSNSSQNPGIEYLATYNQRGPDIRKCVFLNANIVIQGNGTAAGQWDTQSRIEDCIIQGNNNNANLQAVRMYSDPVSTLGGVTVNNNYLSGSGGVAVVNSGSSTYPAIVQNNYIEASSTALFAGATNQMTQTYNVIFASTVRSNVSSSATSYENAFAFKNGDISRIQGWADYTFTGPLVNNGLQVNTGINTLSPATDIYGVTWNTPSTPTIGAAEFYNYSPTGNYMPTERNASVITIAPASTSQSIELYLGATGLTFATSGLAAYYVRNQSAPVAITLVTQTPTGAWSSGGFAEISSSLVPGVYRLDVPNAAFAAGASDVTIVVRGASGTNGAVLTATLSSGGLTAAQTAAAVWDEPYTSHTTASTFGARTLKTTVDNRNVDVGTSFHIQSNVHAIVDSTAAASELSGALLHNGTDYISAELLTPVSAATSVHIGPYQLLADGLGADQPLDVNVGTATSIDVQVTDANGTGIDITGATVSAKVYSSAGTLVATYAGTATYADNGRLSFGLTTTVTATSGTYTITVTRTTGATDTQIFGPLRLYVRPA
jgi:hypothetical protein